MQTLDTIEEEVEIVKEKTMIQKIYERLYNIVTHRLFRALLILFLVVFYIRRDNIRKWCKTLKK
jgi:hypothetical protein